MPRFGGCTEDRRTALREYVGARPEGIPVDSPLGRVLASGASMRSSAPRVATTVVAGAGRDALRELGDSWTLHLPISTRTEVLGVLTLFYAADRESERDDETALAEIASRIAQALGQRPAGR